MGSKSSNVDKTSTASTSNVIDRRAVMDHGNQIFGSINTKSIDDKVVRASLDGIKSTFETLMKGNQVNVSAMSELAEKLMVFINKGQVEIQSFGLAALKTAQKQLSDSERLGEHVLKIADETTGKAMTMAEQVVRDQAAGQRAVLEVLSETKTGDYANTLKTLTGMVLAFSLMAMAMVRAKK